jgi:hypothetical protein
MHADLANLLNDVWARRSSIKSYNEIYSMYNRVVAQQRITNPTALKYFKYVDDLVELEKNNECKVSVQGYEQWSFSTLANYAKTVPHVPLPMDLLNHVRSFFDDPHNPLLDDDVMRAFPNDFFSTFYHYLPYKAVDCTQRVYLNVTGDEAVKVMKYVVPSIVPGLPGCSEAKISGPSAAGARADTIVIYSMSEVTTNAILERLTEYQRLPGVGTRFGVETPRMTAAAQGLVGVAVGAEPKLSDLGKKARRALTPRESFGSMRSKLIFAAFQTRPTTKDAFFEATLKQFASARLSPMAPHVN